MIHRNIEYIEIYLEYNRNIDSKRKFATLGPL